MATLGDLRARARRALEDTDATAYLWSDAELTDDLAEGYREYGLRFPRETSVTITTGGSTTVFTLPSDVRRVVRVESPAGTPWPARPDGVGPTPGRAQSWGVFGGELVFQDAPVDAIVVFYRGLYPVPSGDAAASGLPNEGEDVVVWVTVIAALQRREVATVKRAGQAVEAAALGAARRQLDRALARCRRVRGLVSS